VPVGDTGYPLLNYKKFCDQTTESDFLGPCEESADYVTYEVTITKFLSPIEKIPCLICDDETCDESYSWGGTWIQFECGYLLLIAKDPNEPSVFILDHARLFETTSIPLPNDCYSSTGGTNWSYELRPCNPIDPSAGGLTAKQAYKGLFEGVDLWTPLVY
jgi:hypothetical protein